MYAEVAVNVPLAQPRTFSYFVPPEISLGAGYAVWVPFGNRLVQGIVLETHDRVPEQETKAISGLIAAYPLLSPYQVDLCRWIAERYLSSYFEAAALMLPPGFERKVLTIVQIAPGIQEEALSELTPEEKKLLTVIQSKGSVELGRLRKSAGGKTEYILSGLLSKGLAVKRQEIQKPKVGPKLARSVKLAPGLQEAGKILENLKRSRAVQQVRVVECLIEAGGQLPSSELRRRAGDVSAAVTALARQGTIVIDRVRVERGPLPCQFREPVPPPVLTASQEDVWRRIREKMAEPDRKSGTTPPVFLLHGVTGSGKTEIYAAAIDQAISTGRKAIFLVPEIALTAQTVSRISSRFPSKVAVLHSRLSLGERYDIWHRVRYGDFGVVIGSRGALFAPQPDLGVIVLDEEHEWTYKQNDQAPRFHARDVAVKLAQLTGAILILGSATPDVETYYKATKGEFQLLELTERISTGTATSLPEVRTVDMRRELREGNTSIFSRDLAAEIARCLAEREQAILFLNRRGTASYVQCRSCGHVLRCRRCEVSLTYHGAQDQLVCHRCNCRVSVPQVCSNCGSKRIKFIGVGTQRVEQEVGRMFPEARVLRWDRDATGQKHSHERILHRFLSHEADILIGTQMIAKGLDMPLVSLVGVVNADIGLYLPDFRAGERTFQLLEQVAGRAGRGLSKGRVIIQTYAPEHYALSAAARHDYHGMYEREVSFRRQQGDPPFGRLVRLVYSHTNNAHCQGEAERVFRLLKEEKEARGAIEVEFAGPSPAFVLRALGRYRWQIIIRCREKTDFLSELSLPQGWVIDVDPVNIL